MCVCKQQWASLLIPDPDPELVKVQQWVLCKQLHKSKPPASQPREFQPSDSNASETLTRKMRMEMKQFCLIKTLDLFLKTDYANCSKSLCLFPEAPAVKCADLTQAGSSEDCSVCIMFQSWQCAARVLVLIWQFFKNLPVGRDINLGDFEVEVGHSSDWNAVAPCGKVEELLLQFQREGQHHVPETSATARRSYNKINKSITETRRGEVDSLRVKTRKETLGRSLSFKQ